VVSTFFQEVCRLQVAADMTLRVQIGDIIAGTIFLFVGLATGAIVAIRRGGGVRVFVWLAIWSAMYGVVHLSQSTTILAVLPEPVRVAAPYLNAAMTFLQEVVGSLAFFELSKGKLRSLMKIMVAVALTIAVVGTVYFVPHGTDREVHALRKPPRHLLPTGPIDCHCNSSVIQ
jgi:hypothetical protein